MPLIPGTADVLQLMAAPTVQQNTTGAGAAITYNIVPVNEAGVDGPPSPSFITGANNATTPNNTISWVAIPGVSAYRVLKNGALLATVGAGITTYTDSAGSSGATYISPTASPAAPAPVANFPLDGGKPTYVAAVTGLATVASATDFLVLTGSASKTIRVLRAGVSGVATTILNTTVRALIRTTADSGGTSSAITPVPYDQNDPAATATAASYTANPTVNDGTNRIVASQKVLFNLAAPTAGSESSRLLLDFGNRPGKAPVLRGTAQQLALNLNGVTVAGPSVDAFIEFTEE
jgi:hypothetical protein